MWNRYSFINSSYTLLLIGAYIGMSLDSNYLGGTPQDINVARERPNLKFLGKFLVVFIIYFLPVYIPKKLMVDHHVLEG